MQVYKSASRKQTRAVRRPRLTALQCPVRSLVKRRPDRITIHCGVRCPHLTHLISINTKVSMKNPTFPFLALTIILLGCSAKPDLNKLTIFITGNESGYVEPCG